MLLVNFVRRHTLISNQVRCSMLATDRGATATFSDWLVILPNVYKCVHEGVKRTARCGMLQKLINRMKICS